MMIFVTLQRDNYLNLRLSLDIVNMQMEATPRGGGSQLGLPLPRGAAAHVH